MIALLSYSTSCWASNIPSTGERADSVLISYDDLRIVNSKFIELEYEKEKNTKLRQVIANDSIIIRDYTDLNTNLKKDCKKATAQRNICLGVAVLAIIATIILAVK